MIVHKPFDKENHIGFKTLLKAEKTKQKAERAKQAAEKEAKRKAKKNAKKDEKKGANSLKEYKSKAYVSPKEDGLNNPRKKAEPRKGSEEEEQRRAQIMSIGPCKKKIDASTENKQSANLKGRSHDAPTGRKASAPKRKRGASDSSTLTTTTKDSEKSPTTRSPASTTTTTNPDSINKKRKSSGDEEECPAAANGLKKRRLDSMPTSFVRPNSKSILISKANTSRHETKGTKDNAAAANSWTKERLEKEKPRMPATQTPVSPLYVPLYHDKDRPKRGDSYRAGEDFHYDRFGTLVDHFNRFDTPVDLFKSSRSSVDHYETPVDKALPPRDGGNDNRYNTINDFSAPAANASLSPRDHDTNNRNSAVNNSSLPSASKPVTPQSTKNHHNAIENTSAPSKRKREEDSDSVHTPYVKKTRVEYGVLGHNNQADLDYGSPKHNNAEARSTPPQKRDTTNALPTSPHNNGARPTHSAGHKSYFPSSSESRTITAATPVTNSDTRSEVKIDTTKARYYKLSDVNCNTLDVHATRSKWMEKLTRKD